LEIGWPEREADYQPACVAGVESTFCSVSVSVRLEMVLILSMGTFIFVGKSQRSHQTAPPAHATCTVAAVLLKGLSVCLYATLSSGSSAKTYRAFQVWLKSDKLLFDLCRHDLC
jgi:hypothetical protein